MFCQKNKWKRFNRSQWIGEKMRPPLGMMVMGEGGKERDNKFVRIIHDFFPFVKKRKKRK